MSASPDLADEIARDVTLAYAVGGKGDSFDPEHTDIAAIVRGHLRRHAAGNGAGEDVRGLACDLIETLAPAIFYRGVSVTLSPSDHQAIREAAERLRSRLAAAPEQGKEKVIEDRSVELLELLRKAVNASCSCGGAETGKCCPACDVWHKFHRFLPSKTGRVEGMG